MYQFKRTEYSFTVNALFTSLRRRALYKEITKSLNLKAKYLDFVYTKYM